MPTVCGVKLRTKVILKLHVRSIHEGIKYDCNVCDKSFTQRPHLKKHKITVHLSSENLPCKICDFKGKTQEHLNKHIKNMHLRGDPVECEQYLKKFSNTANLNSHKKIHTNEYLSCNICNGGSKFSQN